MLDMIKWMFLFCTLCFTQMMCAQESFEIRGLAIAAPSKNYVDSFVMFIHEELAPRDINTLILRVDYQFEFKSHPELVAGNALSQKDVDKIVAACSAHKIDIIPQINLLGHQSWQSTLSNLLKVYPEFDETPEISLPEKYEWPNDDGLYCKSYCPLHPGVHKVVFALMDEIVEAFKAKAFHAGMDEVFYIGEDKCPRCGGRNKADLFAGEVNKIRNHLALSGKRLWIWGDRLIDGKATGIGQWEASMNNTHQAIDMIAKDVMICDWHYERADATAALFALKGYDVVTCPWRTPSVTKEQMELIEVFKKGATDTIKPRYAGFVQTVWSGANSFVNRMQSESIDETENDALSFKILFPKK